MPTDGADKVIRAATVIGTIIPHSDFWDRECCGCLNAIIRGDQAEIVCNECEKVIRTVPAADVKKVLEEMQSSMDIAQDGALVAEPPTSRPSFRSCSVYLRQLRRIG
ncbi:MAG: hypothetical protein JOY54_15175 [Acidobacteriaceae bacterium]|nr:hypothetical protein [Acidobacteriaceae bacterium]